MQTVPAAPAAGHPPARTDEDDDPKVGAGGALRLMIVEDDAIGALFLEQSLIDLGYDVCATADSAPVAVAEAGRARPDFVLMDIRLARGTDGIEAAREIRDRFGINSMFLTAHSDAATLRRARAVDPLEFLIKPYNPRELAAAVAAAAIRARQRSGN